jgi:hypothetical protein
MVLVLVPILVAIMWSIHRHYTSVEEALALEGDDAALPPPVQARALVPISRLDRATLQALAYAHSIAGDVSAIHVSENPQEAREMKDTWERWGGDVPLVIVESPYRSLVPPLIAYIEAVSASDRSRPITVVLSEFVPRHFWEYPLHNQTALRLKLRLYFRPNTVVIDVPYHLSQQSKRQPAAKA